MAAQSKPPPLEDKSPKQAYNSALPHGELPDGDVAGLESLPLDTFDDLLSDIELPEVLEEPDDELLALEAEDLEKLVKEEPLELLDHPALMMELSEDPVRLYLKEIGGINLLDHDREFWLGTRMEALRRIESLSRGHPLAWDEVGVYDLPGGADSRVKPKRIYHAFYDELKIAWKRVVEDSHRLKYDCPDLSLILSEAQMLRHSWDNDSPSYLRAYLYNGLWGKDPLWDGVARNAFAQNDHPLNSRRASVRRRFEFRRALSGKLWSTGEPSRLLWLSPKSPRPSEAA